jgi:pectate lyase
MVQIDSPYLAPGFGRACRVIRYDIPLSVALVADATNVGTGSAIVIPTAANGFILKGFFISAAAPAGTAGGAKTVQISVGTAANANTTLSGTDVDIMVASGAKTAAFVHGDAADDHVDAFFPVDFYGKYLVTDTTYYLNYIAQSASATATPGTCTLQCTVWVFADYLG